MKWFYTYCISDPKKSKLKLLGHSISSIASITFQGDKLSTLYLEIIYVAGFFTVATFLALSLYFKKINDLIFGKAQREALALLINIS